MLDTQARVWLEDEGLGHLLPDPHSHEDIRNYIASYYPGGIPFFLRDHGVVKRLSSREKLAVVRRIELGESKTLVAESIGHSRSTIEYWRRQREEIALSASR